MNQKKINQITFLSFLCAFLFITSCKTQNRKTPNSSLGYKSQLEAIRDSIKSLVDNNSVPSLSIGVLKDGEIIWEESFGWADKEQGIKATPETIYSLGSMSKSICATGVMTLVENNIIGLEDKVNTIIAPLKLKGLAANSDEVKIWHILNMSAGIPHGWTSLSDGLLPEKRIGTEELINRFGLVTFPPGKVYHYSNYSMGLGDIIMEKASKQTLEQYIKKSLFEPLGMNNSLTTFKEAKEGQQLASPYSSRLRKLNHYQFYPKGGGGYWSSIRDLLQYAKLHLKEQEQKVLSDSNIDLMHKFDKSTRPMFGLGWFSTDGKLISNGSISGFNSNITLVPEENLAVVVLTNMTSNNAISDQLAFQIVDILAPNLPNTMNREKYAELYETPYKPDPNLTGEWQGNIKLNQNSIPISIIAGENVRIKIGQEPEVILQYPTFTAGNFLHGTLNSKIPVPEFNGSEAVPTWLNLYLENDKMVGHAAPMFSNDKGSFCYGAYIELERNQ